MVYSLKILADTVLKQQPIDSGLISDPRQKYEITEGAELVLQSWKQEGNHIKAAFAETSFNGLNTWYAYSGHVEIWQDGLPLEQQQVTTLASKLKFGIDMGHNAPPDTGARGFGFEDTMTRDVGNRVISKLRDLGHIAINCTPSSAYSVSDSLRRRVGTANAQNVQYYVSIHFNAFNGRANGTEVFAVSDTARRIAQPVLDNIVSLGFVNRGVKNGSHLYVVRSTNMPAILVEGCFVDSQKDMNLYNAEAMANAIVKGLTGQNPVTSGGSGGGGTKPNPSILKLQKALNRLQIRDRNGKSLAEDGFTGPATESATARFNSIMGLGNSDNASLATWDAIEAVFIKPVLWENHAQGAVVRYVQYRVGADIDGIYGSGTAKAVETFQQKLKITADGILGAESWGKLIG